MKPDSTPKTQSVCKHCSDLDRQFAHLKSANTGAWQYRNEHGHWVTCETQQRVSEPASTGEPEMGGWPCGGCGYGHEAETNCPQKQTAARPSGPSAPQTAGKCWKCEAGLPHEWQFCEPAPQASAEPHAAEPYIPIDSRATPPEFYDIVRELAAAPQPVSGDAPGIKITIYDPIAYLQELYADMGKRGECEICLKLQFCIEVLKEKLADSAPSPTPSVSTPQVEPEFSIEQVVLDDRTGEVGGKIVHEQPEQAETASAPPYWMVTRFETLVRMIDRGTQDTSALEEYLELRKKLRELAAPSVAGTQPTPDFHTWLTRVHGFRVGSGRDSYKESDLEAAWNAGISHRPEVIGAKPLCLDCHGAGIINCSHFDNCNGKWVYKQSGAAQGTPQAEEASRKIVEYFVKQYGDLGVALNRPDIDAVESILEHVVGAPAQPGPQETK